MDARELGWLQLHNSIWPRGLVIVVSFRANLGTWTCKQLGTLPQRFSDGIFQSFRFSRQRHPIVQNPQDTPKFRICIPAKDTTVRKALIFRSTKVILFPLRNPRKRLHALWSYKKRWKFLTSPVSYIFEVFTWTLFLNFPILYSRRFLIFQNCFAVMSYFQKFRLISFFK